MTGPAAYPPHAGMPYPHQPVAASGYDPLAGARDVGLEGREPNPPLGLSYGTVKSIRRHTSSKPGGSPGLMITVDVDPQYVTDGQPAQRAFRITFGGQFPQYAQRDCKRLAAAILGLSFADPRAMALDSGDMWPIFDNPAAHVGKRIAMVASAGKIDAKTGKPHVNTRVSSPTDLAGIAADVAETGVSGAPPTAPAAPPPAPSAPAAPAGPPPGWYAFPPSDPRASTHYYNSTGQIAPIGSVR